MSYVTFEYFFSSSLISLFISVRVRKSTTSCLCSMQNRLKSSSLGLLMLSTICPMAYLSRVNLILVWEYCLLSMFTCMMLRNILRASSMCLGSA